MSSGLRSSWFVPLEEDFISTLAGHFLFRPGETDLSRTCVVFAGKRAGLYLHRELASRIKAPFLPPAVMSMGDFVHATAEKVTGPAAFIDELEACHRLHGLVAEKGYLRDVLAEGRAAPGRSGDFFDLFPWLTKVYDFIHQADIENIGDKVLGDVGLHADLGFDMPRALNELFRNLREIREEFHARLDRDGLLTPGLSYLKAVEASGSSDIACLGRFACFDRFLFAGLFGLTGTERLLVGKMIGSGKGTLVWHGDPSDWAVLRKNEEILGVASRPVTGGAAKKKPVCRYYSAPDFHSEAEQLHSALGRLPGLGETVVVLPDPHSLVPVLSFAVDRLQGIKSFNVSLDYPLAKTPVFSLLSLLRKCHVSAREEEGQAGPAPEGIRFHVSDYLDLLDHPFVKNMALDGRPFREASSLVRGLFEEHRSGLYTKVWVTTGEIEAEIGRLSPADEAVLKALHAVFLTPFAAAADLAELCGPLSGALRFLLKHTAVGSYILSGEVFQLVFNCLDRIAASPVASQRAEGPSFRSRLWGFLISLIEAESVHFDTRPLQDLEVLGMLETRNLNFRKVFVLDVQEGTLPVAKKVDPLVPLDLAPFLGLPSPEDREEIYSYYFFRLVRAADEVHLFYQDRPDAGRSRYIEQLIWEEQKAARDLDAVKVAPISFPVEFSAVSDAERMIPKTGAMIERLRSMEYRVTDLDTYLFCQLRFFYGRFLGLGMPKRFSADVREADRGTVIHDILRDTFRAFQSRWLGGGKERGAVLSEFGDVFERHFRDKIVSGEYYLFRALARKKLTAFLEAHLDRRAEFRVRLLEHPLKGVCSGLVFKARIDRLDELRTGDGQSWQVLDYKTGGIDKFGYDADLDRIESPSTDQVRESIQSFQAFLYLRLVLDAPPFEGMTSGNTDAALISAKVPGETNAVLTVLPRRGQEAPPRERVRAYYDRALKSVVDELLDVQKPFRKYAKDVECEYCEFFRFCKYR